MSTEALNYVRRQSTAKGACRHVLAELACWDQGAGRGVRRSHKQLEDATGLSRRTVQRALERLEAEGHIRRHPVGCECGRCARGRFGVVVYDLVIGTQEHVAKGQTVLPISTEGCVTVTHVNGHGVRQDDAGGVRQDDAGGVRQDDAGGCVTVTRLNRARKSKEEKPEGRARERAPRTPIDPDALPANFPGELVPHLDAVLPVLREVAEAKRAGAVHRGAAARIIAARPRRPLVRAAHDFAAYFLAGPGVNRPQRDVVAAYRNWLDRESDLQAVEQLPGQRPATNGGAHPARPVPVAAGDFAKYDRAMGIAS